MELTLERKIRTDISTIGRMSIDNLFECFILEDMDRGLKQSMPISEIAKLKVFGKTAIPSGRYEVILSYSNRFKKIMPLLINVPGYEGIRIHSGNKAEDTEGCLLTGSSQGKDWVNQSRNAFDALFNKLKAVSDKEKIFITIS